MSNAGSHADPNCLTLRQQNKKNFTNFERQNEALSKWKQTRNLADDNLLGKLRVKFRALLTSSSMSGAF